ncbi:MAG: hypothetical protein NVS9B1_03590 [Candidatus Dormibacteraceae bacterium]
MINPGRPQWPGFPRDFSFGAPMSATPDSTPASGPDSVPDSHSQLEELIGHVRRCERWAAIDDRIDLAWRLDGNG